MHDLPRLRGRYGALRLVARANSTRRLARARSTDRLLPVSIVSVIGLATILALWPGSQPAAYGTPGAPSPIRLSIAGSNISRAPSGSDGQAAPVARQLSPQLFRPVVVDQAGTDGHASRATGAELDASSVEVPLLGDGTLVTGYAPDTAVEDGGKLVRRYTVAKGDTLASIARRFKVSQATIYWANGMVRRTLQPGQRLRIPVVSGRIYTVTSNDTLSRVARRFQVDADRIIRLNGLTDPTLVVGQVLVLPGAKLDPVPVPRRKPSTWIGSSMRHGWPLAVRGLLTTTFSERHPGIDLAAPSGTTVRAIDAGRVVWAGWKNNGGGYVVVLQHASGMTSTYNHNRGVSVRVGEFVAPGQKIAEVGSTGNSTGPHLDIRITMGSVFIDPLRILRR